MRRYSIYNVGISFKMIFVERGEDLSVKSVYVCSVLLYMVNVYFLRHYYCSAVIVSNNIH